jgi:hypothetical protein
MMQHVAHWRKVRRLKQAQLAERFGVARETIARCETGRPGHAAVVRESRMPLLVAPSSAGRLFGSCCRRHSLSNLHRLWCYRTGISWASAKQWALGHVPCADQPDPSSLAGTPTSTAGSWPVH